MTEEQIQKGKFHVEEEIHNIQPDVAKLSLLEKLAENLKSPEIKEEIEKQKPKAVHMDKLQAVHDSFRSELERRGVKEASTQTDYNKVLIEQAKSLLAKNPQLKDSIEKY